MIIQNNLTPKQSMTLMSKSKLSRQYNQSMTVGDRIEPVSASFDNGKNPNQISYNFSSISSYSVD